MLMNTLFYSLLSLVHLLVDLLIIIYNKLFALSVLINPPREMFL